MNSSSAYVCHLGNLIMHRVSLELQTYYSKKIFNTTNFHFLFLWPCILLCCVNWIFLRITLKQCIQAKELTIIIYIYQFFMSNWFKRNKLLGKHCERCCQLAQGGKWHSAWTYIDWWIYLIPFHHCVSDIQPIQNNALVLSMQPS